MRNSIITSFCIMLTTILSGQTINVNSLQGKSVTAAFKAAMQSSCDTIFFDKANSPYIFKPLRFEGCSGKTILLEEGVEFRAMKGAFPKKTDALLKFLNCVDISIIGNNATFRMNKEDYLDGEWRHVIRVKGSKNIRIENLTLRDSGGDGITIGGNEKNPYSENIYIDSIKSLNNKRQGISIVSAKNVQVKNSLFAETRGTLPGAGVDIEPNGPTDVIENIVFEKCVFRDNYNSGIKVDLHQLNSQSNPTSILFEDCYLSNNFCVEDVKVPAEIAIKANKLDPVGGQVVFKRCRVEDSKWGFLFAKKNAKGFDVVFEDCSAKNICQSGTRPAIYLEAPHFREPTEIGGFNFNSLTLDYQPDVPVLRVLGSRRGAMKHLTDVKGKFILTAKKTLNFDYDAYTPKHNKNVQLEIIYQ
ncbi:right-handed parallel beta-helix repeat-containing protein [Maribacter sp. 2307UL18-2]|uniref:right-handed parallel beta-helix repeat-containing protein n=1 Tax=Maribacter sp. 2307UL18-2 TaxID=3386274 RepID=UPI0039BCEDBA